MGSAVSCGAGGIQPLRASQPGGESSKRWAGAVIAPGVSREAPGQSKGQTLPEGWEGGCWMGTAGDLGEVGVWAKPLGSKTPWQECVAIAEVNAQTEVGFGFFFRSRKNKDDFTVGYFSSFPEIVA